MERSRAISALMEMNLLPYQGDKLAMLEKGLTLRGSEKNAVNLETKNTSAKVSVQGDCPSERLRAKT
jgi:hypothetical protein